MSDYTPLVNYAAKDALSTGDPAKKILGTEVSAELAAVQTAIASKYDAGDIVLSADGAPGTPGVAFNSDPDTGMYRGGANAMEFSAGGASVLGLTTGQVQPRAVVIGVDGTVSAPSYSFSSDLDTGFYRIGANDFLATSGNLNVAEFLNNGGVAQLNIGDGNVGKPAVSFIADTDSGLFRNAANDFRAVSGGTFIAGFQLDGSSRPLFYVADGVVGQPSICFGSDPDTGVYHVSANYMGLAAGAVLAFGVKTTAGVGQGLFHDGSAATPSISFDSDQDTGFYRTTNNQIRASVGGVGVDITPTETTAAGTVTSGMTTTPAVTIRLVKHGSLVTMIVDPVTGTSNGSGFTVGAGIVPAGYRPARNQYVPIGVTDNGGNIMGTVRVQTDGTLNFFTGFAQGFTGSGTKGTHASDCVTCSYALV